jgi:hypothetical protein
LCSLSFQRLATQGGVERGHGCADLAGIAAGIGFV